MKTPTDWPLPMTDDERIKFRAMLIKHKAPLLIFADDIKHLVFEAEQSTDHFFDKALETLLKKLQVFSEAEEAEVFGHLKKETGDGPRAKRTYGHVVPSKREKARRESGGGNVTSQSSGQFGWDHGFRPPHNKSERPDNDLLPPWDDDIPF